MTVYSPRSKVATYYAWPDGVKFVSSGNLTWSITNNKPWTLTFEIGEEVEAMIGDNAFKANFLGTFAKEGAACPIVSFGRPPAIYHMLGAWSDDGDMNFPPALALSPAGDRLHDDRNGDQPRMFGAASSVARQIEDIFSGDEVLARKEGIVSRIYLAALGCFAGSS